MNETLSVVWPIVTGGLVVPVVAWLKNKLPADFPVQGVVISAALNLLVAYVLAHFLAPEMTWTEIVQFALVGQVTAQAVHAGKKTSDKLFITNGGGQ